MTFDANSLTVTHNEAEAQFELPFAEGLAFLTYELSGGRMIVLHTEVPPALEGRGLGGKLAAAALDYARSEGLKVVVLCPFVTTYIARHPEYAGLVA